MKTGSRLSAYSLLVFASICFLSQRQVRGFKLLSGHTDGKLIGHARLLKYEGEYGQQAAANLSVWRDTLFKRTFQLYSEDMNADPNDGTRPTLKERSRSLWQPFIQCPPDMPLMHVMNANAGDPGKWMCTIPTQMERPCVVYSLGSNGDYGFEDYILKNTQCSVHTFDCTLATAGHSLGDRHMFHNLCLGSPPPGGDPAKYKSYRDIRKLLGHWHVDMVKMDIEGYEYDALQDWSEHDSLPDQLAIEIHYGLPANRVKTVDNVSDMMLLFAHLSHLGYGIVGMEKNSECCSELGLLRVETVKPLRSHNSGSGNSDSTYPHAVHDWLMRRLQWPASNRKLL